jgi:tetratricopeptide (TPR) repeat protein
MADDDVKMMGTDGREVRIPRKRFAEQFLPGQIAKAWDNPDMLYAVIAHALSEGFPEVVADAAQRLVTIDQNAERATAVQGIVWIQLGKVEQAEQLFQTFMERHGPAATILANQARIYFDRGEEDRAKATLRQALSLDPNHPTALAWYAAMHEQLADKTSQSVAGEEEAAAAALAEIAKEPGSWRPQLFMAGDLLKRGKIDEAMEIYRQVLAGGQASAEAVTQVSADLASSGRWGEMAQLVQPVFRLQSHGAYAGMNLLQGLFLAKRKEEAADLLRQLEELKNPELSGHLSKFAARLRPWASPELTPGSSKAAASPMISLSESEEMPALEESGAGVKVVPIIDPVWMAPIGKADWLPEPKADAVKVAIFSLADAIRADGGKQINTSRLTRSIPLYLAEALRLRSDAASMCVLPVAKSGGPVAVDSPWKLDQMLASCPPDFRPDLVICGLLSRGARGARVELHIFGAQDRASLKTVRVTGEDFADVGPRAETQLLGALADLGVHAVESALGAPVASDAYLDALANLAAQNLAAAGLIRPADLGDDQAMLDGYFAMAKAEENSILPTLVAAAGFAAAVRYNSPAASKFKQPLVELLQSWAGKSPIIAQIYSHLLNG